MVDFIRIETQTGSCLFVTIKFSKEVVKSGVVNEVYKNAYASAVL